MEPNNPFFFIRNHPTNDEHLDGLTPDLLFVSPYYIDGVSEN